MDCRKTVLGMFDTVKEATLAVSKDKKCAASKTDCQQLAHSNHTLPRRGNNDPGTTSQRA